MTLSILFYALMALTVVALAGAYVVEALRERASRSRPARVAAPAPRPAHSRWDGTRTISGS